MLNILGIFNSLPTPDKKSEINIVLITIKNNWISRWSRGYSKNTGKSLSEKFRFPHEPIPESSLVAFMCSGVMIHECTRSYALNSNTCSVHTV